MRPQAFQSTKVQDETLWDRKDGMLPIPPASEAQIAVHSWPSRPVTEPLLDCTKFHSLALCRTLRQAICTGRMGLRALGAFAGPGVEILGN